MSAVGGGPFQAVAVVNLPVACFFVHVELSRRKALQVTPCVDDDSSVSVSFARTEKTQKALIYFFCWGKNTRID